MLIENVSDTARWVAVYRAMESKRKDAIFRDPFAERLAGERGHRVVEEMKGARQSAWAMIVRTAVMDEIIMERVRGAGVDLVLNLAAGLDTRAWRLPLPANLQWIDVDLPAISEYKASQMKGETPACKYEAIAADLTSDATRDALFASLAPRATRMLVVTEGLLIYLTEAQVASLARAIHAMLSARWWMSDVASPRLLKMLEKSWGSNLERAPFLFGPADAPSFFGALGWREILFRSALEEARRLNREMRMMWLWRNVFGLFSSRKSKAEMRRLSGVSLFERI
jgi:methyltransferase (TIGR00027 family)